jgi:sugar phosphate isomerase/epimerase
MRKTIIVVAIAIAAPLGAQWLNYPTAGVPKAANGKPNLRTRAQDRRRQAGFLRHLAGVSRGNFQALPHR